MKLHKYFAYSFLKKLWNKNIETLKITNDKAIRNLYSSYTNLPER